MDHHRNMPFPGEGGEKATNPDTDITQWDIFLPTNPFNLNLSGSNFVHNSYGIPRLLQKDRKGCQYSRIPRK